MTPPLNKLVALLLAIVNLRERLEKHPDDERLRGQLLSVEATLEALTASAESDTMPPEDGNA